MSEAKDRKINSRKNLGIKALIPICIIAGLSMGNEGCEEQVTGPRELKMEVDIGVLKGRLVRLPNGEQIDFPYVANSLFYRQVINHNHFVITNQVPTALMLTGSTGQFKTNSNAADTSSAEPDPSGLVSSRDVAVLEKYGLLKQTKQQGSLLRQGSITNRDIIEGKLSAADTLPACLYDLPQAILGGEVTSFQLTGGGGIGIGYGPGGDLAGKVGGRIDFQSSKLELGLRTDDPLTKQVIAIGDGIANQSQVAFGIDFIPGVPVGLNFFFNTPITDVIRKAMDKGLDQVVETYKRLIADNNDWNEVWESRVIYDPEIVNNDTHIAFRGGYRSGVKVGDIFQVRNLHYAWEGSPCYTHLKYKIPLTVDPIAEATVISVGDNVSVAVVNYLQEQKIQPGAQVKVLKLYEPPAKDTKKTK